MHLGLLSGAWGIFVVVGVILLGVAIAFGGAMRRRARQPPPSLPPDSPRYGSQHPERPDLNRQ